jgi:ferredoxin
MRVRVDVAKCQGHTLCNRVAPEIFKLRPEDGHSVVENPEVPVSLEDKVRRAAMGCPEDAIVIGGSPKK